MKQVRPAGRAVLAAVVAALTGCATGTDRYCGALEDREQELADLAAEAGGAGAEDAHARTLELLEELQAEAPRDIGDEWSTLVLAFEGLVEAFADAGISPADYDPAAPAEELSEQERRRIEGAAAELGSARVLAAAEGVEQHGRDVCKVDLGLGTGE